MSLLSYVDFFLRRKRFQSHADKSADLRGIPRPYPFWLKLALASESQDLSLHKVFDCFMRIVRFVASIVFPIPIRKNGSMATSSGPVAISRRRSRFEGFVAVCAALSSATRVCCDRATISLIGFRVGCDRGACANLGMREPWLQVCQLLPEGQVLSARAEAYLPICRDGTDFTGAASPAPSPAPTVPQAQRQWPSNTNSVSKQTSEHVATAASGILGESTRATVLAEAKELAGAVVALTSQSSAPLRNMMMGQLAARRKELHSLNPIGRRLGNARAALERARKRRLLAEDAMTVAQVALLSAKGEVESLERELHDLETQVRQEPADALPALRAQMLVAREQFEWHGRIVGRDWGSGLRSLALDSPHALK